MSVYRTIGPLVFKKEEAGDKRLSMGKHVKSAVIDVDIRFTFSIKCLMTNVCQ